MGRNPRSMIKTILFAVAVGGIVLAGCGDMGKPDVSEAEQKRFANPIKEPPPEAGGPPATSGDKGGASTGSGG